jgi:hypothetical protein
VQRLNRLIGLDEKLQLHLLEFAGAEGVIARRNLVAKGFADLSNAERCFLPRTVEHVLELRENRLRGFRTEINLVFIRLHRPGPAFEHEIERTRRGQLPTAVRARCNQAGGVQLLGSQVLVELLSRQRVRGRILRAFGKP